MLYAKVNAAREIVQSPVQLQDLSAAEVAEGIQLLPFYITVDPEHDPVTQKIVRTVSVLENRVEQVVTIVDKPLEEIEAALPALKQTLISQLAEVRYVKETAGVVIAGQRYATDRESRSVMATSIMTLDDEETVDWKSDSGWVVITKPNLIAISTYLKNHVKACFTHEKALGEEIQSAATVAELRIIDILAGWPSNE